MVTTLFHYLNNVNMTQERIIESENDFTIELAHPGMEVKDFKINVERNRLTVDVDQDKESFFYPSHKRYYKLPEFVDRDKISATYRAGILKITVPRSEESKKDKILVEVKGE